MKCQWKRRVNFRQLKKDDGCVNFNGSILFDFLNVCVEYGLLDAIYKFDKLIKWAHVMNIFFFSLSNMICMKNILKVGYYRTSSKMVYLKCDVTKQTLTTIRNII